MAFSSRVFRATAQASASRAALRQQPLIAPAVRRWQSSTIPPTPERITTPKPELPKWRRRVQNFGRVTLVSILTAAGAFWYYTYQDRHPGSQLPQDPSKKTIVVLGSGWAATSFLKNIDTTDYNVVVVSPRNYFLFTPLLPSVTVGTLDVRSIIQPTRFISRHKAREVKVYEAEAEVIDVANKTITISDNSEIKGAVSKATIPYDYLIYAVGAENATFGIPGVTEHACFLKEAWDAGKIRTRLMDCIETAALEGQTQEEIDRLLHMVVVGGGPTGVEYAGELHDFLVDDLQTWYPDIANRLKITLIEALPNVLPMFSKQLIQYTESTFKENKIDVLTRTMVKGVAEKSITVQDSDKTMHEIPYGLLVWATGNTARPLTRALMAQLPQAQTQRRGLTVDDYLRLAGTEDIWALGDCTATQYAPTAQAANQQGVYLARTFGQMAKRDRLEKDLREKRLNPNANPEEIEAVVKALNRAARIRPFHYSHQGSLAYIGSERAIADLPFFNGNIASGGLATYYFWRSAYISNLYSLRNRTLVSLDWCKNWLFGRDVSRE